VGAGAAVEDEVEVEVLVDVGPGEKSLTAGACPRSAASMAGSLPSIPRAHIPIPRIWNELARAAFNASEVGLSK
jgi:hypothetical protein